MKPILIATFTALLLASTAATAGDIEAGKAKSAICASCHGPAGHSVNPLWPNLAGQKEQYLIKQIKAFRDGTRKDPMMAPMVAALSDEDIANLAAYYASQE
jgi:cytochrome c553